MNFNLLKSEVRELVFQELSHRVTTEEQFQDQLHDILHTELDREVGYLSLIEIEEVIIDFGLNEALYIAMSNCGLCASPVESYGENVYSPAILYQAVLENISITWDDYKEWRDEQDEQDEDEEEEEKEKTNCDDCNELFKTVGSLTVRMMFEDKFLCKDCCVKRCDAVVVPEEITLQESIYLRVQSEVNPKNKEAFDSVINDIKKEEIEQYESEGIVYETTEVSWKQYYDWFQDDGDKKELIE